MNILLTGATGFIGTALSRRLVVEGHSVTALQRKDPALPLYWDPVEDVINLPVDTDIDVFIHLAGESVIGLRWTKTKKSKILQSRVQGTKLLCESLKKLRNPPSLVVCASAVGFYGNTPDASIDEEGAKGCGFLADVCEQWETASHCLDTTDIRLVTARFGVVLSREGGMLESILPQFQLGLGGVVGSGEQHMSWVSLTDLEEVILFIMNNTDVSGVVNIVSPCPIQNKDFTSELACVLNRPAFFKVPSFVIRCVLGEMGQELLLNNCMVQPSKLIEHGFEFTHPQIKPFLSELFPRQ